MKVRLDRILDNPFRDFSLHPLDQEQINRLVQSIGEIGFFSSVTARPAKASGYYELGAGHHRIAAAREYGLSDIEVNVQDYDDMMMVRIMAMENLTQNGTTAAATLDSVAAFSRIVAREVLLGEGGVVQIYTTPPGNGSLEGTQALVAKEGPGRKLLYRIINGFDYDPKNKAANRDAERIKNSDIVAALSALKEGGIMGLIVADALTSVEAIRAARNAEAEAAAQSAAERKALAERQATDADKHEKQRAAVAAQVEVPSTYDPECVHVFRLPSHEAAFRSAVLSENGKRFIPIGKQVEIAKGIRQRIDKVEDKRNHDLGSVTIKQMVEEVLTEAIRAQDKIDAEEKEALLLASARARVEEKWKQLAHHVTHAMTRLQAIAEAQEAWNYDAGMFPLDHEQLTYINQIAEMIRRITKQM